MIIDFRMRPPVGGFLKTLMYRNVQRTASVARSIGMELPPSVYQESVELMLEEMESAGIGMGVVQGRRVDPYMGSVPNEDVENFVRAYPGKFFGFAGIDPTHPEEALAEIDKVRNNDAFKGIVLEPGMLTVPMYANDRRIYPIYERCGKLGILVVILAGGNVGPDISYSFPLAVDQVAADFPKMTVIISHGGWPWGTQILHVAYRRPNVYISPDQYLVNLPGMNDYILAANYYLQDRFLFATSYPFLAFKQTVDYFKGLPFRPEVLDKLLYKNAARLLGLEG